MDHIVINEDLDDNHIRLTIGGDHSAELLNVFVPIFKSTIRDKLTSFLSSALTGQVTDLANQFFC